MSVPVALHSHKHLVFSVSRILAIWASLGAQMAKNLPAMQETQVQSLGQEDPWRREWMPTPVFLPGEFHGQRSLAGYSPWGRKESGMTEQQTCSLNIPGDSRGQRSLACCSP